MGEGVDGKVGLFTTFPSKSRVCRLFAAKSYKIQELHADPRKLVEAREKKANDEMEKARNLYCRGPDALFPENAFQVKTISGQPMFCQPYFQPIPPSQRKAALAALPALLAHFVRCGLRYDPQDNEVHWRHFLMYRQEGETSFRFVLVDFCRLVPLKKEDADDYVAYHIRTLRHRMTQDGGVSSSGASDFDSILLETGKLADGQPSSTVCIQTACVWTTTTKPSMLGHRMLATCQPPNLLNNNRQKYTTSMLRPVLSCALKRTLTVTRAVSGQSLQMVCVGSNTRRVVLTTKGRQLKHSTLALR